MANHWACPNIRMKSRVLMKRTWESIIKAIFHQLFWRDNKTHDPPTSQFTTCIIQAVNCSIASVLKTNEMRNWKMNEMRPSSLHNPWFFVPISNSQCIAFVRTVVLENKRIRKTPITELDLVSLFKEHFRLVKVSAEHEMRLSNGKQLGSIAIYPN